MESTEPQRQWPPRTTEPTRGRRGSAEKEWKVIVKNQQANQGVDPKEAGFGVDVMTLGLPCMQRAMAIGEEVGLITQATPSEVPTRKKGDHHRDGSEEVSAPTFRTSAAPRNVVRASTPRPGLMAISDAARPKETTPITWDTLAQNT